MRNNAHSARGIFLSFSFDELTKQRLEIYFKEALRNSELNGSLIWRYAVSDSFRCTKKLTLAGVSTPGTSALRPVSELPEPPTGSIWDSIKAFRRSNEKINLQEQIAYESQSVQEYLGRVLDKKDVDQIKTILTGRNKQLIKYLKKQLRRFKIKKAVLYRPVIIDHRQKIRALILFFSSFMNNVTDCEENSAFPVVKGMSYYFQTVKNVVHEQQERSYRSN